MHCRAGAEADGKRGARVVENCCMTFRRIVELVQAAKKETGKGNNDRGSVNMIESIITSNARIKYLWARLGSCREEEKNRTNRCHRHVDSGQLKCRLFSATEVLSRPVIEAQENERVVLTLLVALPAHNCIEHLLS